MGKKMNQASVKISKEDNKRQLNSLIKVLRPKVYITDSSSFKNLVQELTGNGNSPPPPTAVAAPPPPPPPKPVPVIEIHDENNDQFFHESSLELSVDSTELLTTPAPLTAISQSCYNSSSQLRDLESWLLEIDHQFPDYAADHQEVCAYDYDLSGFM